MRFGIESSVDGDVRAIRELGFSIGYVRVWAIKPSGIRDAGLRIIGWGAGVQGLGFNETE